MTYEESLHTIVLTYILLYVSYTKLKANNLPRKELKPILLVTVASDFCARNWHVFSLNLFIFCLRSIRSSPTGEVHILLAIRSGNPSHFVFVRVRLVGTYHYWLNFTRLSFQSHFKVLCKKKYTTKFLIKLVWKYAI